MAFTVYIGPQKNDFTVGLLSTLLPLGQSAPWSIYIAFG